MVSQGTGEGPYETFVDVGGNKCGGDLAGRWILTSGLGGMGGAQPFASSLASAASLSIECQPSRIEKRIETRYLDVAVDTLDDAMLLIEEAVEQKRPLSVGLLGNAAEILPEMVSRNMRPEIVTDPTSAHDVVNGYLPAGWPVGNREDQGEDGKGR